MGESKNDISTILALINPANTISVNRCMAHSIGLEETVIFQALVAKYVYWQQRNMLEADGSFFSTVDDLEESTSLSDKKQRRLLKTLDDKKLVAVMVHGCPPKRYMYLNLNIDIISQYIKEGQIKTAKKAKLNLPKGQNQNCQKGAENYSNDKPEASKPEANNNMSAVNDKATELLIGNGIRRNKAAEIVETYGAARVVANVNYVIGTAAKWKNIPGAMMDAIRQDYVGNMKDNKKVPPQLTAAEKAIQMMEAEQNGQE